MKLKCALNYICCKRLLISNRFSKQEHVLYLSLKKAVFLSKTAHLRLNIEALKMVEILQNKTINFSQNSLAQEENLLRDSLWTLPWSPASPRPAGMQRSSGASSSVLPTGPPAGWETPRSLSCLGAEPGPARGPPEEGVSTHQYRWCSIRELDFMM